MKLQRCESNGNWYDEERINFIERAAEFGKTTIDDVIAKMATEKMVHFGTDWYEMIRDADAIKPKVIDQFTCSVCGFDYPISNRMSSSRGTCCPDCYDSMSD